MEAGNMAAPLGERILQWVRGYIKGAPGAVQSRGKESRLDTARAGETGENNGVGRPREGQEH